MRKMPQLGNVVLQNQVEIGANCTIDRGTMGSTLIKYGCKLDNLIHVAHNVEIGRKYGHHRSDWHSWKY
jgi:UDP-3-O-[3-hydroxymyristoyl] glucosamine N-acyltransferase